MERGIKKNRNFIFYLILFIAFVGCDSNRVFDEYKSLKNDVWERNQVVSFEFQITDTLSRNNLFINIRNDEQYAYSNLYLITDIQFPDGKKIVDTLQYAMTDKTGKFLGSGISEIKESKLFYKENTVFPSSGIYKVSLRHAMRKNGSVKGMEKLEGVTDVGFRIEKTN